MGWMGFGRARASVISMAAVMSVLAAGPALAASELKVVLETGSGGAALVGFNATGGILGGFELTNAGHPIAFDDIGSVFYAADGELKVVLETGTGGAALVGFNATTGGILGGFELTNAGNPIGFEDIGSVFYAPDGELKVVLETGTGTAALVGFNTAGGILGGFELTNAGNPIAFEDIGSVFYGPDGELKVVLETGTGTAALVGFNAAGGILGGFELSNNGNPIAFADVGAVLYAPDGELKVLLETGGHTAALVGFDAGTGGTLGGVELDNNGNPVPFDRVGAVLYSPAAQPTSAVPEPATWAMLICGFGAAGVAVRRRRLSAGRWAAARTPA